MKKGILFLGILFLVLVIGSVSAALCKGNDGYYHDCGSRYRYGNNNYMDQGYGKNLDYSYGKNINNDYGKNTVYRGYDQDRRSQYKKSDYVIRNNYYITYEDRDYRSYNNYDRKSNRRVYFSSYKGYDKNYNKGKDYNVRNYDNKYQNHYSNKRTNYKVVIWVYEKSDSCPYGWYCVSGNRDYW